MRLATWTTTRFSPPPRPALSAAQAPQGAQRPAWAYMEGLTLSTAGRTGAEPIGGGVKSLNPGLVEPFIAHAERFLNQPYLWGGGHAAATRVGPVDCSGLVLQAARMAGFNLDGTARMQQDMGRPVSMNDLRRGDLLFRGNPATHVGIYLGDGKFIHAPRTGDVVRIASLSSYGGFDSARRIFDFGQAATPAPASAPTSAASSSYAGPVPGASHGSYAGPLPGASQSGYAGPLPDVSSGSYAGPLPTQPVAEAVASAPVAATPAAPLAWHVVQPGESLPRLAQALYGDMNRWSELHALNADLVPNPNMLLPGQQIRVPAPAQAAAPMPVPTQVVASGLGGQLASLQQAASGLFAAMVGQRTS